MKHFIKHESIMESVKKFLFWQGSLKLSQEWNPAEPFFLSVDDQKHLRRPSKKNKRIAHCHYTLKLYFNSRQSTFQSFRSLSGYQKTLLENLKILKHIHLSWRGQQTIQ